MSNWPSAKARRVLAALLRIGWRIKRQSGSHRTLARALDQGRPQAADAASDGELIIEDGSRRTRHARRDIGAEDRDALAKDGRERARNRREAAHLPIEFVAAQRD